MIASCLLIFRGEKVSQNISISSCIFFLISKQKNICWLKYEKRKSSVFKVAASVASQLLGSTRLAETTICVQLSKKSAFLKSVCFRRNDEKMNHYYYNKRNKYVIVTLGYVCVEVIDRCGMDLSTTTIWSAPVTRVNNNVSPHSKLSAMTSCLICIFL